MDAEKVISLSAFDNLKRLTLYHMNSEKLVDLPYNLIYLDIRSTKLEHISNFPDMLEHVSITKNEYLEIIPQLP